MNTNLQTLLRGIQHIAGNHNFECITENWYAEGQVTILGNNVPTLADVQFLCKDIGLDQGNIYACEFGIDVEIPYDWIVAKGEKEFAGDCFWQRR